ncbi:MAG TPA: methane monooxygenase/ammonia monooxygenase subunit C, partial [Gammaproteobacteria bacterium]|nr:methane monooxygenase/ammonia monooxygenase subunit C [Gammaproteobacteria bacterium]
MSSITQDIGTSRSRPLARRPDAPPPTEGPPRVPWGWALGITALVFAALTAVKWYQHAFSWSVGMDSFSDEFQTYWMSIFYTEIIAIPVLGGLGALALWLTRDRDIMSLSPHDELRRFYAMFGILTVAAIAIVSALGLLTEADAAWHQVVVRDTDFTPTHIFLFYLGIPVAWGALILAWIWVHTRLPIFTSRISVPFSVAILGFMMVGPVVAFNEWAHTFFYAEELFAAPVHWFFVLAGFFLVFLIGFVVQCLQRMRELMHVVSYEELELLAAER